MRARECTGACCQEEGKFARVRVPRAANTGGRKYLTCVEKLMREGGREGEGGKHVGGGISGRSFSVHVYG